MPGPMRSAAASAETTRSRNRGWRMRSDKTYSWGETSPHFNAAPRSGRPRRRGLRGMRCPVFSGSFHVCIQHAGGTGWPGSGRVSRARCDVVSGGPITLCRTVLLAVLPPHRQETSMEKQPLGRSGLEIAPLVLGGNVFGWTADESTSFDLLNRFTAAGFNAIDTADSYSHWAPGLSGGESETVMGKWLARRGRRDDVVIMTKVGSMPGRKGLSGSNIAAAVEDSLRRLQTDYLDVYFAHIDDDTVPLEETIEAFSRLVDAGKVRTMGA